MADSDPAGNHASITPSDSVDFTHPCRGIYIGVTGDIVAVVNGTAQTYKNAQQGTILPIEATRVNNTNTTATNLLALW